MKAKTYMIIGAVLIIILLIGVARQFAFEGEKKDKQLNALYLRKEELMLSQQRLTEEIAGLNATLEAEIARNEELAKKLEEITNQSPDTQTTTAQPPPPVQTKPKPIPITRAS